MRIRRSRSVLALVVSAVVGLVLAGAAATQANATSATDACSEPPSVRVDQSDTAFTTISISLACEAQEDFHRIVTASVGGSEVLRIDTRTDVSAAASHRTEITIPKAQVCVIDGETGKETCLPS